MCPKIHYVVPSVVYTLSVLLGDAVFSMLIALRNSVTAAEGMHHSRGGGYVSNAFVALAMGSGAHVRLGASRGVRGMISRTGQPTGNFARFRAGS